MHKKLFESMSKEEDLHWWYCGRREILKEILSKIKLPPNPIILEVGCGTGGNLNMLRNFGTVYAFEKNSYARMIALDKTLHQVQIKKGDCPDNIPQYNLKFDLICLFDVLEHILEDQKTIKKLSHYLAPNGKFIVTVPAYKWLFSDHDRLLHHFRRYQKKDLMSLSHKSGLKILKMSYFNFFMALPIILIRVFFRNIRLSHSSKFQKLPYFMNNMLLHLFSFEKYIVNLISVPFGISIYAILKKTNK